MVFFSLFKHDLWVKNKTEFHYSLNKKYSNLFLLNPQFQYQQSGSLLFGSPASMVWCARDVTPLITFTNPTLHLHHIPQCTTLEQKCVHFCSKMVHGGIWERCRVGFVRLVYCLHTRAPSQYPKRRLFVRSREISKPRDWYFKLSHRFEIWQAHRQQCCRSACQISERSDNSKYKSHGFETSRDLTERRLFGYWDGAQNDLL